VSWQAVVLAALAGTTCWVVVVMNLRRRK